MSRNEQKTREELIDPNLKLAGWDVLQTKHIIEKNKACIEVRVQGMPKDSNNQKNDSGVGFVDYVLFGDNGKPLAIIEAKRTSRSEEDGENQARNYAKCLEKQYGVWPIIYITNGYSIKMFDGIYPARKVIGFHKKEELEYLIQKRNMKFTDKAPNATICGRYYQIDAIKKVLDNFENKKSRSLIVLATGTGKTRIACGISDIFLRNNMAKRILFLADRKNLVRQAKEDTFEKFLPNVSMATIVDGNRQGMEDARIVFSTYQSMLSIIKDTTKSPFGIGHFDLIIIDEAHRSLFNKYAEIFNYFDALMLGLTATPRGDIHKSTYKVFNLAKDEPNYEYELKRAVDDGFLVYFKGLDRTTEILKNGVSYKNLSEEDKEQYEETFTEDDGTLPATIEGETFRSVIMNKDTVRKVLECLMKEGLKVNNGDVLGKTIIFARDHNHAELILETFREMYPEYQCAEEPNSPNKDDFCVIIDNRISYNEDLQREFKSKQNIRIVISVDMMDTGVDIPEVVNLVFFKKILSKIKFWQMIGRGTRKCENINVISPSSDWFEDRSDDSSRRLYKDKQGFLIFDCCNVFDFFDMKPEGNIETNDSVLSLNQKIFKAKVTLLRVMQDKFVTLSSEDKQRYRDLKINLHKDVIGLNKNSIGVKSNLKYVEKFSDLKAWDDISKADYIEIIEHIVPIFELPYFDDVGARLFDLLSYKFSSTKLNKEEEFAKVAKVIHGLDIYLLKNKMHIDAVSKYENTLNYINSNDFILNTSVNKMEEIRIEFRELMRYIEKAITEPIITDFDDSITSEGECVDVGEFNKHSEGGERPQEPLSILDFKSLKEQVVDYIALNSNDRLVYSLTHLIKPDNSMVEGFREVIMRTVKGSEKWEDLFSSDEEVIIFVRKNMTVNEDSLNSFIQKQKDKGFNEEQIDYVKELFVFIFKNGCFSRSDLIEDGLNHFIDIFDSEEIGSLLAEIEEII